MLEKSLIRQNDLLKSLQVDVDRTLVSYAFRNLMENAFKFEAKHLYISGKADNGFISIEFKDDGPGIPPEDVDRVFEPFYQVDADFTGQVAGPGLGLTVVKQVVESHGGKVWVDSAMGRGSTFFVQLPRAEK